MTPRSKSALLLVGCIVLGMVLGGLLTGVMVNRRLQDIAELRTPRGLAFFMEDVIRPESDEQREAIREILDRAAPRYTELFRRTHSDMRALTDSVVAELGGVLTDAQRERLERHMEMRPGPPFGGPLGPPGDRRGRRPGPRHPPPPPE